MGRVPSQAAALYPVPSLGNFSGRRGVGGLGSWRGHDIYCAGVLGWDAVLK